MSFINLDLSHPVARALDTTTGQLPGMGARFVMDGAASEGRVALVEHPIGPRGLAAPMHRHSREDEYSFILEGMWGFQLGDDIVFASPGDLVFKPRDVWHTFWNASDEPARLLEITSPSGFEQYFVEMTDIVSRFGRTRPDLLGELAERYGLSVDFDSIPGLMAAHSLVPRPEPNPQP